MTLLFTMIPFYLLGNLHCFGMCGPLVMMMGQHRYRYGYFLGRTLSFSLAGMLAGEVGAVLTTFLQLWHISALTCFLFGGIILASGLSTFMGWRLVAVPAFVSVNQSLSLLMLRDHWWPTFLFGFFTVFLPCGQTVVVFSACALSQDAGVGLLNGCVFALLTSPALFFAMQARGWMQRWKHMGNTLTSVFAIAAGLLALWRGVTEFFGSP